MPWLKGHHQNVRPVERDGIYTRLSDGSTVIDCRSMSEDSGVPLAVIKSEIEHHYMHGRHFYKDVGSMVERGCYESWKAERLDQIKAKLHLGQDAADA
jgi:hypothetical protein